MRKGYFLLIVVLAWLAYRVWSQYDRVDENTNLPATHSPPVTLAVVGANHQKGNLVGIQPYMVPADYATEERFYQKLKKYFVYAQHNHLLTPTTVVVLPEHIGTWLVAAGEKRQVFTAKEVNGALRLAATANLFSFLPAYAGARAADRSKAALFLMKAEQMAAIYSRVFKRLAKEFEVTIAAGSVFLPGPEVAGNTIKVKGNTLYNAAFLFHPDGRLDSQVVIKQFPITEELQFCRPGTGAQLPVFATPLGKLAVVVCADSWYPGVYDRLHAAGAEIMVVPSYASPDGLWAGKWQGYNGAPMPADVDRADVGNITEEAAWLKYSMGGRAAGTPLTLGINVFLRGDLWDLGDDGRSIVYTRDTVYTAPRYDGPQITVVWVQ